MTSLSDQTSSSTNRRRVAAIAVALSAALISIPACSNDSGSTATDKARTESNKVNANGTGTKATDLESGEGIDVMPVPIVGEAVPPVEMDKTGEFGNGVTVRIAGTQSTEVKAELPGETTGPAIAVALEITNNSKKSIDLSNVIVDLTDAEGGSFNQVDSAKDSKPFTGQLAAGASASANIIFRAELQKGSSQYLTVKYSAETPTVVFAGRITND